jgi:phosphatidylserine/phosphatidylglycerophosphate/cardiolipin synthase-like enzyme
MCVSSFLIQEGRFTDAMLRAVRRGVRSYILTAREEELKMSPEELGEKKGEAIESHKRLLDAFAGKVLVRTAPHFHAKFALFDPLGEEPKGVLATCNLTQGAMAGSNIEIAMTLTEAEIRSLFIQFLQGFWNESHHELIRKDGRLHELTHGGFEGRVPVGEIAHPCTYSGANGIRDMAIELITGAKRELILGAWSFVADHRVLKEVQAALDRGVKVRILARPTRENTLALSALSTNGATVVGFHKQFHAKFLMTENGGLLSSANWTKRGLDEGFEAGMALKSADAVAARELIDELVASGGLELRGSTSIKDIPNGRHLQSQKEAKELVSINERPCGQGGIRAVPFRWQRTYVYRGQSESFQRRRCPGGGSACRRTAAGQAGYTGAGGGAVSEIARAI